MFTLIGSIIGFLSSAFPSILKILQDHRDKKHELELLKLQISNSNISAQNHLEEVRLQTQALEMSSLYNSSFIKHDTWVDSFAATVRPVITYAFFLMYLGLKIHALNHNLNVWTQEDETIFATLISFWFGHRTLNGKQYIYRHGK